ncbi:hypothetical protein V8C86DRAFT_2629362 [Haematococcus lacustris]
MVEERSFSEGRVADAADKRDGGSSRHESSKRKSSSGRVERSDRKSSRRSRSGSRDRKSSKRSSRSPGRGKSSRRSRSDSRDRRRRRSRSRDVKKSSSSRKSRSRSRDRSRRSRSRDRRRTSSRRSPSSSSDEIGGYKPRKRQEPPPVITNGPGTGSDPFASMRQPIVPNDPQAQLRMWQLQQLEARTMVLEQQAKSAATATSKTQREVYVGGLIPGAITGEALRTLFNSALAVQFQGHLMPGMDPVINVNLHPEGKYSFVEFRIPDMATAALALSGQVQLLGCNLSVARPSGYVDPSKALNSSQATAAALAAFKRGDMQALAAAALAGANLRGLGLPPHIEDPASAAAPQVTPGVNIDGLAPLPTSVVCITGMVTAERLKSDEEYNGLKEDLQEQCNGIVKDCCLEVKIPRPHDPALSDQYLGIANYGRVFVKFVTPEAALVCKDKIHGRLYGGSLVQVYFITDEAFTKA